MLVNQYAAPRNHQVRVVIVTDAANEADDAFAIAHALLTPSFEVRGLVASHFKKPGSMERSYAELIALLDAMGLTGRVPLEHGAEGPLSSGVDVAAGTRLVRAEALRDDDRPLFVLCLGGLTEMALALRACPEAAGRMSVVWVGGGRYPAGSHEANLDRDVPAAREVFASEVPLWQIPSGAFKRMTVSVAELRLRLSRSGALGEHLWEQLNAFASANIAERAWIQPESWVLGDSSAVGVLLAEQKGCYTLRPAPDFTDDFRYVDCPERRQIRVYHDLDVRMILEDMFAKFELAA